MEEKTKIIDQIVKRHPSYGVSKGWSTYVGGMADTGEWYFRKMLDVPEEELKSFLEEIVKMEDAPVVPYTNQELKDMSVVHKTEVGRFITEQSSKALMEFYRSGEKKMLFKPKD